jgi:hypothetical protein
MRAPTFAVIAKTFIQYLEHTKIIEILIECDIIEYYKYLNDIVYNTHTTNIDNIVTDLNSVYAPSRKKHNKVNYLDLTIMNQHNN